MAKHKIEVTLTGTLTGIDITINDNSIVPDKVDESNYHKLLPDYEINNPVKIHIRLDGYIDMKWTFQVKIDDKIVFSGEGEFNSEGYAIYDNTKNI